MPYLNVDEVDSAVLNLAATYPAISQLITLPNQSVEGRVCHALRLGAGDDGTRDVVLLLGGIHAREWGSCEILLNLAADLLEAYSDHCGLTFGDKSFTADEVASILDGLHLIVFPLANPDGRHYSQTVEPMWRKNRNPAHSGGDPNCIGVDLNRNYDFLFDFETAFAPDSGVSVSADPCDFQVYHGPSAFSEPETRNVKWFFDTYRRIRWFVDVHSYSEDMLYVWGDDDDQTDTPAMNFRNAAFDGKRGVAKDTAYREYIPESDFKASVALAQSFCDALTAVRGKTYTAKSSFDLYPVSGASDDYAFARHILDPDRSKVYSYTVEWGTEFQPPWAEMENIVHDVTAGLIGFCLAAPRVTSTA